MAALRGTAPAAFLRLRNVAFRTNVEVMYVNVCAVCSPFGILWVFF